MPWVELLAVFVISHMAGDFILQTEFQATGKFGGLGRDPVARRALALHIFTYTLCFVPALVWIGDDQGAVVAVAAGLAIAIPHAIQDDGRLIGWWMEHVKHTSAEPGTLKVLVDQSFHMIALLLLAVIVGG